jgi:hypothetical protein
MHPLIFRAVWILYLMFTFIHLLGNYKAVTALELETFNEPRMLLCLKDYLSSGSVSSVKNVNSRESVLLGYGMKGQIYKQNLVNLLNLVFMRLLLVEL